MCMENPVSIIWISHYKTGKSMHYAKWYLWACAQCINIQTWCGMSKSRSTKHKHYTCLFGFSAQSLRQSAQKKALCRNVEVFFYCYVTQINNWSVGVLSTWSKQFTWSFFLLPSRSSGQVKRKPNQPKKTLLTAGKTSNTSQVSKSKDIFGHCTSSLLVNSKIFVK